MNNDKTDARMYLCAHFCIYMGLTLFWNCFTTHFFFLSTLQCCCCSTRYACILHLTDEVKKIKPYKFIVVAAHDHTKLLTSIDVRILFLFLFVIELEMVFFCFKFIWWVKLSDFVRYFLNSFSYADYVLLKGLILTRNF